MSRVAAKNFELAVWEEFGLTTEHWEAWKKTRDQTFDEATRERVAQARSEVRSRLNADGARRAQRVRTFWVDVRFLSIVALIACVVCLIAQIPVSSAVLAVVAVAALILLAVAGNWI